MWTAELDEAKAEIKHLLVQLDDERYSAEEKLAMRTELIKLREKQNFILTKLPDKKKDPVKEFCKLLGVPELDAHCERALLEREGLIQKLEQGKLKKQEATSILMMLQNYVTTEAAKLYSSQHGYVFDGPITVVGGQAKSTLQYVIKDNRVFCAKVSDDATVTKEYNNITMVHDHFSHCPTIVRVVDTLLLHPNKRCIILPFYPRAMSDLKARSLILPEETIIKMAICVLASIKALSDINLCHGDIKPGNIMLDNYSDINVLIDFGSAVIRGDLRTECTPPYGLDVEDTSTEYDLTCLGVTILQLNRVIITSSTTKASLVKAISDRPNRITKLATLCLTLQQVEDVIAQFLAENNEYEQYAARVMPLKRTDVKSSS